MGEGRHLRLGHAYARRVVPRVAVVASDPDVLAAGDARRVRLVGRAARAALLVLVVGGGPRRVGLRVGERREQRALAARLEEEGGRVPEPCVEHLERRAQARRLRAHLLHLEQRLRLAQRYACPDTGPKA